MKFIFTLLLIFTTAISQAKDNPATIYYLDGASEKGFIKSFLEYELIDINPFKSFEKGLPLNDQSVKFKNSENAEFRKIATDIIEKIVVHFEKYDSEYRALYIRKIDSKGELKEAKVRIFLPLVRAGKVNLYGFYYKDSSMDPYSEVFYLQNAKENYAFNYYDFGLINSDERLAKPLKLLFNDCPEIVEKVHEQVYMENLSKSEKRQRKKDEMDETWTLMKEYRKIPKKDKRGDLLLFHQYHFNFINSLIMEYEHCNE